MKLTGNHNSRPYNPDIARGSNVFKNRTSATHDFQGYFRKTLTTGETITV